MIDFHCHLDLYPKPEEVVRECADRGLYVLSVTTTPSAWEKSSALVAGTPRIRTALGLHPELAHERRGELELFDKLLPECRYVGEIGLDGSPQHKAHWPDQTFVFEHVLSACKLVGGRIMTVHSRRAVDEVLDRLEACRGAGVPVLHWYSGGQRSLARAIELGCWFSVGPGMIAGAKGRALVAQLPRDRVLTETDGPFANVNGRSAVPWDVGDVINVIAEVWATEKEQVDKVMQDNLRRLTKSL